MSTYTIASFAAYPIVGIVAEIYFLWIFYLAVMALKRAREDGTISRSALLLGYPILAIGYILDMLVNITACSLLVWDWPRELTVSAHLSRLLKNGTPRRKATARWIAENLLDAFDPSGKHIGE